MVPKLRFSEFSKGWQQKKIGEVFTIFSGFAFKSTDATTSGCRWLKIADVGCQIMTPSTPSFLPNHFRNEYHKFIIRKDDYVIALTRPILNGKLKIAIAGKEYDGSLLNQRVGKIVTKNNPKFVYSLLQMESTVSKINNCIAGTDPPNLSTQDIKDMVVFVPIIEEQTKIADFLSSVDERITLLNKQYDLLCQYKKGMMQKIFSQKIRFKSNDGSDFLDWRTVQLSECLYEHKKRNKKLIYSKEQVLSVSGDVGIVNQIKFLGRSYAGESVENYHIVHQGDIVYTKSPLKENPFGIIKSNKGNSGIVSTLYAVYSCLDCIDHNYIDYYFSRKEVVNNYLKPLVNKGAKNDMKVNNQHVLTGDIVLPCREEQEKIVSLLSMLDDKIAVKKAELDKLRTWKQGLLQQMFV